MGRSSCSGSCMLNEVLLRVQRVRIASNSLRYLRAKLNAHKKCLCHRWGTLRRLDIYFHNTCIVSCAMRLIKMSLLADVQGVLVWSNACIFVVFLVYCEKISWMKLSPRVLGPRTQSSKRAKTLCKLTYSDYVLQNPAGRRLAVRCSLKCLLIERWMKVISGERYGHLNRRTDSYESSLTGELVCAGFSDPIVGSDNGSC